MTIMRIRRIFSPITVIGSVAFVILFGYCILATMHWQVVSDQSVFHYIRFLMSRGLRPYSDITDMNLPGCYLLEMGAMAIFGWSDASWRVYEFFLFAILTGSGIVIGGRRAWFAGPFAAIVFMLVILSQGERFALERDEAMAIFCVAAVACFFTAVRRRASIWMLPFGLLSAFAATLKPSGIVLQLALLVLLLLKLHRDRTQVRAYLWWTVTGDLGVGALLLGFFLYTHSFRGFLFVVTKVWPVYAETGAAGFRQMTLSQVPLAMLPLVAVAGIAAFLNRRQALWQRSALLCGVFTGVLLYYSQLRPAAYHRATTVAFLALWIGFELSLALQGNSLAEQGTFLTKLPRLVGATGIALLFVVVVPYYVKIMEAFRHETPVDRLFSQDLESDLNRLGGRALQNQVECLDMVDGCLRALYQDRLVQNTGSTGDMLLFSPRDSAGQDYYRNWYTVRQKANPAEVIVVSNAWYQSATRSFQKLQAWPDYDRTLSGDYVLVAERFPFGLPYEPGYQIYVRKGSTALKSAEEHGLAVEHPSA